MYPAKVVDLIVSVKVSGPQDDEIHDIIKADIESLPARLVGKEITTAAKVVGVRS